MRGSIFFLFANHRQTIVSLTYMQGGRGHWAVYNISPQSFILTISYLLA